MKPKAPVPVFIEWVDSHSTSGWELTHEPKDLACISVGLLVQEYPDRIVIAQSHAAANGEYCDFMEIPRVAVKKLRRLR